MQRESLFLSCILPVVDNVEALAISFEVASGQTEDAFWR
jgi:hypothetical protein